MAADRKRVTVDVKNRLRRIRDVIDSIIMQRDAEFSDARSVFVELIIVVHEIEAAAHMLRRAWWPRGRIN
jgi:hypothetical protein